MAISISGNGKTVYGPRIARDGLILYYDALNTKSFKGEPTTNLAGTDTAQTLVTHADSTLSFSSAPEKGEGWKKVTITARGANFRLAQFPYINQPTNTVRTYSLEVDMNGNSAYYWRIDGAGGYGTISIVDGKVVTTITTTSNSGVLAMFLNNNTINVSGISDVIYYRYYQVEDKAYATRYVLSSRGSSVETGGGWADLTTNAYHGVLTNGTREDTAGRGSLLFDGVDDYISIVSPSNRWEWTPSGSGLNTMTIDLWVKTTDADGYVVSKPWNGNGEYNYWIHAGNSWYTNIGNQFHYQNFTSYATGNWENVTCIVTPTQKAVYRNGVLNAAFTNHGITNNIPGSGNSSLPLALMTLYPYENTFNQPSFSNSGNLGLFRIYNRVLTATEIAYNYQANRARYVT